MSLISVKSMQINSIWEIITNERKMWVKDLLDCSQMGNCLTEIISMSIKILMMDRLQVNNCQMTIVSINTF